MANPWDGVVGTAPYNENLERIKNIAEEKGFILNPDEERVKKVVGLMTMNFKEYNKYYCPCKQSHPLDPTKDVVCPCSTLEQEVNKDGHCYCRLFYKKET
ncbi:MAG TPA: ferredoxin:thioredoxin reductase [candidate division WOR-3 bacterium]|uniref:Ferredoxin:thioredoxin reductase n=1 Tax=candidate division WOR-3 bacterium TaxID=2052148 RepID=A0A9C9EL20_UNCW3|nr:ferredoxin:thioredoxin reductase [candidate division WOR-3 bacterium]